MADPTRTIDPGSLYAQFQRGEIDEIEVTDAPEPETCNDPEEFDEAECEARGRADRAAGVGPMDPPYVAGLPLYAWERGYDGEVSA